ncbi:MAG: ribosome silencing factor [Candidatus Omnitrophica bacterium]|nr:ribosome silencing factor [Candidatus Omnitrophota bacterium]
MYRIRSANIESKKLALKIASIAQDRKAQDLIVIDLRKLSSVSDYFVICSGSSLKQIQALSDIIQDNLAQDKIKPLFRVSGNDESGWVVLDFQSVMVHLFYEPMREFYDLERLWSKAKKIRIPKG